MRNSVTVSLLAALVLTACDPAIRKFEVTPKELVCSGQALVQWEINGPGGELSTSKPVVPPLPSPPPLAGSQQVTVTETTEFSFSVPGAGHRHQTVTVLGTPKPKTLNFTGQCADASTAPTYNIINVSKAEMPGKLTAINAIGVSFPVHVFVGGTEIALGATGEPLAPLPDLFAAAPYSIKIPGVVGPQVCKDAGATGGGEVGGGSAPAPAITIVIKGSC
jgi:hypothetical protein